MLIAAVDRPIAFTMESGSPSQRVEPITLAWIKKHLRFPFTREDLVLSTYVPAARTYFEEQTGRECVDATYEYALDGVPVAGVIELPRPPLVRVTAITYDDGNGIAQTMDPTSYRVISSAVLEGSPATGVFDPYCPCGRVELVSGSSWPSTNGGGGSLRIRRVCGYGATADAMPPLIQATIGMLTQYFFERGSEKLPVGVETLISGFKWSAIRTVLPTQWTTPATLLGVPPTTY